MTNKEAIPILERLQEPEPWEPQISRDAYEALEMAIEALERVSLSEQEKSNSFPEKPSEDGKSEINCSDVPDIRVGKTDGDTISRQAAIDALRMDISIIPFAKAKEYVREAIETIYNRLEELPSAQPVDEGYLMDWYISSVDDSEPVWTEAHIEELMNDFYLIPRGCIDG